MAESISPPHSVSRRRQKRFLASLPKQIRTNYYAELHELASMPGYTMILTVICCGSITFPEFKRMVGAHFANMADLWIEFDANFAGDGDRDQTSNPLGSS